MSYFVSSVRIHLSTLNTSGIKYKCTNQKVSTTTFLKLPPKKIFQSPTPFFYNIIRNIEFVLIQTQQISTLGTTYNWNPYKDLRSTTAAALLWEQCCRMRSSLRSQPPCSNCELLQGDAAQGCAPARSAAFPLTGSCRIIGVPGLIGCYSTKGPVSDETCVYSTLRQLKKEHPPIINLMGKLF